MTYQTNAKLPEASRARNAPSAYVYFVLAPAALKVKIGRAVDPLRRLHTLGIGSPEALEIIGLVPTGSAAALEAELHRLFDGQRDRGEWFDPTLEMVAWVQANALVRDEIAWELHPDQRPAGWSRPRLPRCSLPPTDGWSGRTRRHRSGSLPAHGRLRVKATAIRSPGMNENGEAV